MPLPSSSAQQPRPSSCSRFSSKSMALHLVPAQAFHLHNGGNFKHTLRIVWIRESEVLLSVRRIRCSLAGVAPSSIQMGCPSMTLNEEVYHGIGLLVQGTTPCYGAIWPIGEHPTPSSTGGIFKMAISPLGHQESLEAKGIAMLIGGVDSPVPSETTQEAFLSWEMDKNLGKANDNRALLNEINEGCFEEISKESSGSAKDDGFKDLDAKENLRRQRISIANKGKAPWNKGKKHSEETKNRIRKTVTMKMQDPKLRDKLRRQAEGVKTRPETLLKIKTGIRNAWKEKRRIKAMQEECVIEWMEMIANAARKGEVGETTYEWDSYISIRQSLQSAFKSEKKKRDVVRRSALSTEHRLRISEAIKAKWSDPSYREKVKQGVVNAEKKRIANSSYPRPKRKYAHHNVHTSKSTSGVSNSKPMRKMPLPLKRDVPAYKDSEAEMKLEKIKSMRADRVALEEIKRRAITERARVLIAQAKDAAKALEAAAMKDKSALAPLLETRRLLAEAVRSIELTSRGQYGQPLDEIEIETKKDKH